MRDLFIIGASSDDNKTAYTSITGTPTSGGGDKDAHLIAHNHTYTFPSGPGSAYQLNPNGGYAASYDVGQTTGTAGKVDGTNMNLPPYVALYYIMKT